MLARAWLIAPPGSADPSELVDLSHGQLFDQRVTVCAGLRPVFGGLAAVGLTSLARRQFAITSRGGLIALGRGLIGVGRGLIGVGRGLIGVGRGLIAVSARLVRIRERLVAVSERLTIRGCPSS